MEYMKYMDNFLTDINLEILPEEGKKELINYYQYLLKKYNKRKKLEKLLSNPKGKLPTNFKFSREDANDR